MNDDDDDKLHTSNIISHYSFLC